MTNSQEIDFFKIGVLSKKAEVSKRTIRYYEELELLTPSKVSEGGFRLYTKNDLQRLMVIKGFKELGFSLDQIKELLHPQPDKNKKEKLEYSKQILKSQLEATNEQIEKLKKLRQRSQTALEMLAECQSCSKDSCPPQCPNRKAFL
ncbi:MerR family transcriptional regulator [Acetohalobium arabaticum]|uniref:Transcriptional regulator, MerR family n=1 Tax=Acetohalobium arabaticum (strain ATCC 49924 / DSM 5501 / Z-7288) TaxID=574087 RepID=D9QSL1_ACEAZ|nr:MerR family transcriptional regulator [Acetohalobium arabaticum]ADL13474.1 transcriptional regulator, MerR family [Acetohalobium arabaticum DSM 5501]